MRRKRVELEQTVIVAARNHVHGRRDLRDLPFDRQWRALVDAIQALDDHDAAEMTGQGARWVHGSPETSEQAAALAAPVQGSARHRVVEMLATNYRGTDDQLELWSSNSHQTISSARNWLVEAGWVRDSGHRRNTRSGRAAVCWELTPAALRQIGDL